MKECLSALNILGARIRQVRLKKGLTQKDVAYSVGLDPNYIGLIERGQRNPSFTSILRIAKGLGVTVAELIDDETFSMFE